MAQTLSFWLSMMERDQATTSMMMGYIEREVASSVPLLDHLPAAESLTANAIPGERERMQVHLQLSDGTPLTIDIRPMSGVPMSRWLPTRWDRT